MQAAGVINIDASDKGPDSFVSATCLISGGRSRDCPGYMIGSEQDWKYSTARRQTTLRLGLTPPSRLISVMLRKSYAGAHFGMLDKSIGADFVLACDARVTIVGAETAASVIFAREIRDSRRGRDQSAGASKNTATLRECVCRRRPRLRGRNHHAARYP